ncbi:MAG: GlsB/YeaQ/YmgE family stress response membrane protein [Candidatus Peribacteraceae bacterium]|nr:GlsB/YeaQ/YmgE family stress response membrane protein [Candidatus Peribacteraceae bacterium]
MATTSLLTFLFIGLVAGWLAGELYKGYGFGLIGNIIVGILGALIGGWLFGGTVSIGGNPLLSSIITATIGALILLALIGFFRRTKV